MSDEKELKPLDGADYIRPFAEDDRDIIEQLVGQGYMESLTKANNWVYKKPTTIAFAVIVGGILNYYLGFYKSFDEWHAYVALIIGPAFVFLPLLGIVEYLHRPMFEKGLRTFVRGEDIRSPSDYYVSPSGCWVFQHKDKIVGVVMLDCHSPGKEVAPGKALSLIRTEYTRDMPELVTEEEKERRKLGGDVAEIRHVDVDAMYRKKGVGMELLGHALDEAFVKGSVKRVIVLTSPFTAGGEAVWKRVGFQPVEKEAGWREDAGLGWDKWHGRWLGIDREGWLATRAGLYEKYAEKEKGQ